MPIAPPDDSKRWAASPKPVDPAVIDELLRQREQQALRR
jgi:hypothetical protein